MLQSRLHPGADPAAVKKWLENAHIDPNDPGNAVLMNHLQVGFLCHKNIMRLYGKEWLRENKKVEKSKDKKIN